MEYIRVYKKRMRTMIRNSGVSLLETVMYVALLALMLVIVLNTLVPLSASFAGIRLSKEVNTSAVTALERLTSEVKKAKSIDQAASIFNANPGVLALSTTDGVGNPATILFSVNNGVLQMTGGSGAGALTANAVTVSNFTVRFIDTGHSGTAVITVGLTGTRGKTIISDTFQTAAVTRNQGM